jgi:Flp pilus assembly pilin Flp
MGKDIKPQELSKNSCEAMEYTLAVGLIIVAGCAVVGSVGVKVMAEWHSVSTSMDGDKAAIVVKK